MPLPASGQLSFYTIGTSGLGGAFGAVNTSNIGLTQYYSGGSYIETAGGVTNTGVPGSGTIAVSSLYGAYLYKNLSATLTIGSTRVSKTSYYGYCDVTNYISSSGSSTFGSISPYTFVTPRGTFYIAALYWTTGGGTVLALYNSAVGSGYVNDDATFTGLSSSFTRAGGGYSLASVYSSSKFGGSTVYYGQWSWASAISSATSGSIAVPFGYLG
jgi:hypothetical protein